MDKDDRPRKPPLQPRNCKVETELTFDILDKPGRKGVRQPVGDERPAEAYRLADLKAAAERSETEIDFFEDTEEGEINRLSDIGFEGRGSTARFEPQSPAPSDETEKILPGAAGDRLPEHSPPREGLDSVVSAAQPPTGSLTDASDHRPPPLERGGETAGRQGESRHEAAIILTLRQIRLRALWPVLAASVSLALSGTLLYFYFFS